MNAVPPVDSAVVPVSQVSATEPYVQQAVRRMAEGGQPG